MNDPVPTWVVLVCIFAAGVIGHVVSSYTRQRWPRVNKTGLLIAALLFVVLLYYA